MIVRQRNTKCFLQNTYDIPCDKHWATKTKHSVACSNDLILSGFFSCSAKK